VSPAGRRGRPAAEPGDEAPLARVEQALADRQPHHMVPDLDRITTLMDLLGSPQRSYRAVHVTGTNGKTSTARMIETLLRAFGLRTGRYTSPHLVSVTERIVIDGEPLSDEAFARAYDDIAPYLEMVDAASLAEGGERVTFFELLTALAFAAFADAPVDVAVVEVGMGGAWDATNVLAADTTVLTPVALDHPELGPTPAAIAREKAGIVHEGALLVSAAQLPEVDQVVLDRIAEVHGRLVREGPDIAVVDRRTALGGQVVTLRTRGGVYPDLFLPLHGAHQAHNALLAVAAVEELLAGPAGGSSDDPEAGPLDHATLAEALAEVTSPGRLEQVRTAPTVLLDAAHNPAGARALAAALGEAFSFRSLVGVVGVLADKDARGIFEALEPVLDAVVVVEVPSPRALDLEELEDEAVAVFGAERVEVARSVPDALDLAVRLSDADSDDLGGSGVLVAGSIVLVGVARALLARG
jgi:dihydrofolate synthase/folylpolyglutamate synthase